MKRFLVVVFVVIFTVSLASLALAEMKKGTIKAVDEKAGTVVFCPEGSKDNVTMKVDKSVDLKKVKPETKVEINVENNVVKEIKPEHKKKEIVGC